MTTSNRGKSLIKKFEGLRLTAYRCAAGVLTIGYGHTTGVTEGMAITEAEAERLLSEDLKQYERAVNNALPTLRQNQFDALVSFTFNLGEANLFSSTLLKKARVNPNDPALRAELMKWVNVNKKPLEGLRKRRAAEADLYFA